MNKRKDYKFKDDKNLFDANNCNNFYHQNNQLTENRVKSYNKNEKSN